MILAGVLLTMDWITRSGKPWMWLGRAFGEVRAAVLDQQTQWMIVLTLGLYVGMIWLVYRRRLCPGGSGWRDGLTWLVFCLGWCGWSYGLGYGESAQGYGYVWLLATVVAGLGMGVWVLVAHERARMSRAFFLLGVLQGWLVVLATVREDVQGRFRYWDQARWSGLWGHPNEAGLLMALGLVLAVGWAWSWWAWTAAVDGARAGPGAWSRVGRWVGCGLALGAAGWCAWGWFHSYSRGAWLAALVGLGVLAWYGVGTGARGLRARHGYWQAGLCGVCIWALGYWDLRDSEVAWIRRVYSVVNPDDFSWRNRLAGWEAALQMLVDRPWLGWRWDSVVTVQGALYGLWGPAELGAIQLNGFLMIGLMSGWPALVGLCLAVGLLWRGPGEGRPWLVGCGGAAGRLGVTARAGAAVLVVGAWFGGGLWDLKTGTWLWLLLLLGAGLVSDESGRGTGGVGLSRRWWGMVGAMVGLSAGLIVWAKRGDPFERRWHRVKMASDESVKLLRIQPRHGVQNNVVLVCVFEGAFGWRNWGRYLCQLAGLGCGAVGLDLSHGGAEEVSKKLGMIRRWVLAQAPGADLVWVGVNGGGAAVVRFLAEGGIADRWVWIGLTPGGTLGMGLPDLEVQSSVGRVSPGVWVSNGSARGVGLGKGGPGEARKSEEPGVSVREVRVLQWREDRPEWSALAFRLAGEEGLRLAGKLEQARGQGWVGWRSMRWPWWWCMGPALIGWAVPWVVGVLREGRWGARAGVGGRVCDSPVRSVKGRSWWGWLAVGCLVLGTAGWWVWHWTLANAPAGGSTWPIVQKRLVGRREVAEVEWLLTREGWMGRPWRVWLEHAHLAVYTRGLVNWHDPEELYRAYVLDPWPGPGRDGEAGWRRLFWEQLYPRIRREGTQRTAAAVVLVYLRSRVGVAPGAEAHDVVRIWRDGWASSEGFARLCVAGLRSVGIPARLGGDGGAEFWDGSRWLACGEEWVVSRSEGLGERL